jgi:hypothetical protein
MNTDSTSWCKDDEALARYAQDVRRKALLDAATVCEHFMQPERLSDVQSTAVAIRQRIYELGCDFDHPHPSHPCGRRLPEPPTVEGVLTSGDGVPPSPIATKPAG